MDQAPTTQSSPEADSCARRLDRSGRPLERMAGAAARRCCAATRRPRFVLAIPRGPVFDSGGRAAVSRIRGESEVIRAERGVVDDQDAGNA